MRFSATLVASAAFLCLGCAVTRERAGAIAERELARRKVPLPDNYTVRVVEGFSIPEGKRSATLWVVHVPAPHRKDWLYSLEIDPRSGAVTSFSDSRYLIPSAHNTP